LIFTILFFGLIGTITTLYAFSIPKTKTEINDSYFANCSSNSDCDSLKGLQCSAQNGVCSCPAYKTKGHCDCSKGYYWSGYECRPLFKYLETGCTADYMCESYKTKYIYCINNTCKCESHKIFDTTSQKCKYNYLGCFDDIFLISSNIYIYFAAHTAVIDACINACRIRSLKYTVLSKSSNSYFCNCASTISFLSPVPYCDTTCLGKDSERYPCANSGGTSYYRSVYSNLSMYIFLHFGSKSFCSILISVSLKILSSLTITDRIQNCCANESFAQLPLLSVEASKVESLLELEIEFDHCVFF
jgi:hypothetical protein